MEIKKLLLQLLFVFGLIFILTFIIIFLYNFLMSGVISLEWRMPLLFSALITLSYLVKYLSEKKKKEEDHG